MMSEFRGGRGFTKFGHHIVNKWTLLSKNSDMGEGGGQKTPQKFGHHLWMVPNVLWNQKIC